MHSTKAGVKFNGIFFVCQNIFGVRKKKDFLGKKRFFLPKEKIGWIMSLDLLQNAPNLSNFVCLTVSLGILLYFLKIIYKKAVSQIGILQT